LFFGQMKLRTKITSMAICSVAIPVVIILAFTQVQGRAMKSSVNSEISKMSDSELASIAKGVYETIDQAVNAAIRINCLSIAKNAKEGVHFFYNQFKDGTLSEEEAKHQASNFLLSQKIGDSGYVYVLSREGKILAHPKQELVGVDLTKHDFIRNQLSLGSSGFLEYMWKNPGEDTEKAKCLGQEIFEPWGWIITASGYKKEFARLTKTEIEPSIRKMILEKKIGETGYVYVIGGSGEHKGHYLISYEGKRDNQPFEGSTNRSTLTA
jgi:two-component system, NtrC family, sensor kinase